MTDLAGDYVLNTDSRNEIILNADGTYEFHYFGDGQFHTANGKWQLNAGLGAPHPMIVLDNYNPGYDPSQGWGSYPLVVERRRSKTVLAFPTYDASYYLKQ